MACGPSSTMAKTHRRPLDKRTPIAMMASCSIPPDFGLDSGNGRRTPMRDVRKHATCRRSVFLFPLTLLSRREVATERDPGSYAAHYRKAHMPLAPPISLVRPRVLA